jgi:hypothetical protein
MILNKRSKTSQVSLQGALHVVVPTTEHPYVGEAKRRLDRAFAEMTAKYGIEFEYAPSEPRDHKNESLLVTGHGQQCYAPAGVAPNGDYVVIQCDTEGRVITSPHSLPPDIETLRTNKREKYKSDELPKCIETDNYRKRVIGFMERYGGHDADAKARHITPCAPFVGMSLRWVLYGCQTSQKR